MLWNLKGQCVSITRRSLLEKKTNEVSGYHSIKALTLILDTSSPDVVEGEDKDLDKSRDE